jgi:hypothetical protein
MIEFLPLPIKRNPEWAGTDEYHTVTVFGNPLVFGIPIVSMLNILGMILMCGIFKDTASFSPCPTAQEHHGETIRAGRAKKRIRSHHRQPRILRAGSSARRIVIIAGTATNTCTSTTIMAVSFDIGAR